MRDATGKKHCHTGHREFSDFYLTRLVGGTSGTLCVKDEAMSSPLKELSNTLAGLVEAAGPHIVRVEARRRLPATGVVYSADGLIITSNHVVERDDDIRIGLADGST